MYDLGMQSTYLSQQTFFSEQLKHARGIYMKQMYIQNFSHKQGLGFILILFFVLEK